MAKVFFSYSHKDETMRNEIETHLAMLKRDGTIETWHDRRILAGTELDGEIDNNLEEANIILLLISPYFMDSDYCMEREMMRAMEKHEDGSATVIPIFLQYCDWKGAPFGRLLGIPTDAKPISQYADYHEALSIVAKEIRRVAEKYRNSGLLPVHQAPASTPIRSGSPTLPRTSNLAIKRKFDDHECDEYLENTYEYIARFFEGSLQELTNRNSQIKTKFKRVDANSFSAWIYDNGKMVSECSVYNGAGSGFGGSSIRYSSTADTIRNSFNESLIIGDDGYKLYLTSMMKSHNKLTEQGAAEMFWTRLIERLQ